MERAAYETFARNERDHFWFVGRRAIFFDQLRRLAPRRDEGARVLDLGCGVGGMFDGLSEFGRPIGMDLDRDALRFCRDRGQRDVFRAFGHRLPFADGTFAVVAAFDVLEHIPQEAEAIAECFRVLRPGGVIFVSGPAYQFLYTHQDKMVHHQRRYRVSVLERRLRAGGFEILKGSYINFFLFPLIFVALMIKKFREVLNPPTDEETRFNTDVRMPGFVNRLFAALFSAERHVLRRASFPTGHSLFVVARKPEVPA